MKTSFDISKESDIPSVVQEILPLLKHNIIVLKGNLGAGKTTFSQYLVAALGSQDSVTSPTYSLVNEYLTDKGKIFHFDLYRLQSVEEVYDMGMMDYLDSNQLCIIEWPEIFMEEFDEDFHEISIFREDNKRTLKIDI